ncbi:MAG: NAD(+)/NADH kinase [Clostridiales bacterium]|nr:NAD(+)/NADH kinase [Clostridiales bacterium]
MKIALIANHQTKAIGEACAAVRRGLESLGAQVLYPKNSRTFPPADTDRLLEDCDLAVALGGDGTIIHIAKRAAQYEKAVLGINCGHLGFTAGLESDELSRLPLLIEGQYTIERRMLLEVGLYREEGKTPLRSYCALNEAVISRGSLSRMVELEVTKEGALVTEYRADGVIIAAPTGSTAYSLSAGGPIVDPKVHCLLMTPVCPHSLYARSFIFSDSTRLTIRPLSPADREVYLTIDGEEGARLEPNCFVTVSRGKTDARLIKIKQGDFYDILNQKLMDRR